MEEITPKYYSESRRKATDKYKAKAYHRIPLDVRNEEYEAIKAFADANDEKVNGFIRRVLKEYIEANS